MTANSIDVTLPDALQEALAQPICIALPKPGKAQITLPTGGTLKGISDITKSIPDDCSLSFSLALQLGPFLANLDCLLKIMKVLEPLINVVTALAKPDPFKAAEAAPKLIAAVPPLVECFAQFFIGVPLFVRDILCLIIKLLRCVLGQLKSVMAVLGGLSLQIASAKQNGNTELLAALQCAEANANASAQHMVAGVEPILVLLSLAEPLLGIAGVSPIKTPAIASPEDLAQMQAMVDTLDQLVKTLQLVADGLGGCGG